MAQLHAQGGVPQGWKFSIPRGDAAEGRGLPARREAAYLRSRTDGGMEHGGQPMGGSTKMEGGMKMK